jgi:hypothetical protein
MFNIGVVHSAVISQTYVNRLNSARIISDFVKSLEGILRIVSNPAGRKPSK